MKTKFKRFHARLFCAVALGIGSSFSLAAAAAREAVSVGRGASEDGERESVERGAMVRRSDALTLYAPPFPWSQLGAKAGADYQGDGLAVSPTVEGARLRCVFQRLEGEATREGLWLTSTVTNAVDDRFRVTGYSVARAPTAEGSAGFQTCCIADFQVGWAGKLPRLAGLETRDTADLEICATKLPRTGNVSIDGQRVRFTRP